MAVIVFSRAGRRALDAIVARPNDVRHSRRARRPDAGSTKARSPWRWLRGGGGSETPLMPGPERYRLRGLQRVLARFREGARRGLQRRGSRWTRPATSWRGAHARLKTSPPDRGPHAGRDVYPRDAPLVRRLGHGRCPNRGAHHRQPCSSGEPRHTQGHERPWRVSDPRALDGVGLPGLLAPSPPGLAGLAHRPLRRSRLTTHGQGSAGSRGRLGGGGPLAADRHSRAACRRRALARCSRLEAGQSIVEAADAACRYLLDLTPRQRLQMAGVLAGHF
jgi:hypothetical protein